MTLPPEIRALIFDLDGVLWTSSSAHEAAYREVLQSIGIAEFDYATVAGRRTDEALATLLAAHRLETFPERIAALVAAKREKAKQLLRARPPLVDRCAESLQNLAQRYTLALASSASPGSVDLFLEASASRSLFSVVLSGEDVAAAKPAPDIYLTALRRLEIPAHRAVVFEDAVSGIRAARAAGISVIGVGDTCTPDELAAEGVCAIIDSIGELLDGDALHS